MLSRGLIFIALAGGHAVVLCFTPAVLTPVVAGSVYLLLVPLQAAGMPVLSAAESGGWSSPLPLGWAVVCVVWATIWWAAAGGLSRLFSKHGGHA